MTNRLKFCVIALLLAAVALSGSSASALASGQRKVDLIQYNPQVGPRVIPFSPEELVALGAKLLQQEAPGAVRDPQLQLSNGAATATLQVDFSKLRRMTSSPLSLLLRGEHEVVVSVEISSGKGTMRVHPTEIRIGSVTLSGDALDYAITNVLLPYYPDAIVDRDFALTPTINRIQVTPTRALVYRN
jgi:hypothetical protein